MDLLAIVIIVTTIAIICFFVGRKFGAKSPSDDYSASQNPASAEETEERLKRKIDNLSAQITDLEARLQEKDEMLGAALSGDVSKIYSSLQNEVDAFKKKVEKLKKELGDAEDERDDFEDEAKSAKKKLEKKTTEYKELSTKMQDITLKFDSLQRDYNTQADQLEDEKVQNKERKESIEFVNAILNAKEASDEYTKSRNEAIDNVQNTLLNYHDALTYCDLAETREYIMCFAFRWANDRKKPWLKGKKVIALIGEFSAGKTSIVNRILSQDDPTAPILPTNSKATTAIPTYISYGPAFMSQFLDANGTLKNIKKDDFERVKKDVLNKVNVSSLLNYFVMSYNNANLKGITILDTPGFSSNDPEDERRTCEVINEADILFWVFDVNQAINKTSITIIKENIKDVPLFVVMNKCDQLSPNEQNAKENNLRETLKKENISINGVIRFSEKYSIDVIMNAVNSVECKKEEDEVSYILEDLYRLYDSVNDEYKECQEDLKLANTNLDDAKDGIQSCLEQYENDARAIDDMVMSKKRGVWGFRKQRYEISKNDIEEFKRRCQKIRDNREELESEIENLEDFTHYVTNREKEFSYLKYKRRMLSDYEKKIIEAVKKFDPNANIPVHVISASSNKKRAQTKHQSKSSSKSNNSGSLHPSKSGNGFEEDLRDFMDEHNEPFLLKVDVLYLAKQYGISESKALDMAEKVAQII